MFANGKYSFKENGMKNQPIVKMSRQSLEGVIFQRSDRRYTAHHACTIRFLARSSLKLVTRLSLIRLVKFEHFWFS